MRHELISKDAPYDVVDLAGVQNLPNISDLKQPFRSASAAPDVPAAVGRMLVTAYVALLATFALTLAHSRESLFALAICAVFLTMYLSIPRIFLSVEPDQRTHPSLDRFLREGLETYTGHCSGGEAMTQMLLVPVLLTGCALAMGIIGIAVD
jgi:hypothetical protein